jgi:hypothetical protein
MNVDLEEDFKNSRWRLLALVEGRRSLSDGSEGAIQTDSEIIATRNLIRSYEVLKGYWSKAEPCHRWPRHAPNAMNGKLQ